MRITMNRPVIVSFIGIAVAGITFGLVGPVTVILLETHHAPGWITGAITTMLYLSVVLFSSFTGRLVDRYRTKRVLGTGFLLVFLCSLASIWWDNYYVIFPARFISGIGSTFIFVTTEVIVNASSNETNRGKNISGYVVFLSIGIALGTFLIWTVNIAEWVPFVIGSAMILLAFVFETLHLDEIELQSKEERVGKMPFLLMPPAALLSAAIYGVYEGSLMVVIPLFALRSGFSQNEVAYFLSAFVTGGILLLYVIGRLSDRIQKYTMLLLISASLTVLLAGVFVWLNTWYLIVVFFMLGGVVPAFYSVGLAYTIEKVETQYMAQANGHFARAYGIGTILGPLSGSFLLELNLRYSFWAAAALLSLIFFLYFSFVYREK